ncbi:MAG TPA: 4-(cytidine 5'-diphospho)-2-C-methyl-D-erythritol kinase [Dermatophilaceae bacterium]|mgnify:CR=1 FL=1|nr:4-(cytidine 5'-diphospho)-2-C-methyl-D-erythritol kinase [Dermatophilaceae bacterium]
MTTAASSRSVTVRAPAKVNCELRVGPRQRDGYHELATVFMAVGIYDEVTVTRSDRWSVHTTGPYAAAVPDGGDNLALRAARLLARRAGVSSPAVEIGIAKEIPVAGGMAGGSADAAAALLACDHLWRLGLEREELLEIAAELGADVPFSFSGGIAVGSGRGDVLAPVLARGTYHWVFAISAQGLSTPHVFAECDRLRGRRAVATPQPSPAMMTALRSGDPEALAEALGNDLQEAAVSLQPALQEVIDAGAEFGALGTLVSGSGPTVAMLARSSEHALDLAVALTASGIAAEVKRAKGPVHGCQLIAPPRD